MEATLCVHPCTGMDHLPDTWLTRSMSSANGGPLQCAWAHHDGSSSGKHCRVQEPLGLYSMNSHIHKPLHACWHAFSHE